MLFKHSRHLAFSPEGKYSRCIHAS